MKHERTTVFIPTEVTVTPAEYILTILQAMESVTDDKDELIAQ